MPKVRLISEDGFLLAGAIQPICANLSDVPRPNDRIRVMIAGRVVNARVTCVTWLAEGLGDRPPCDAELIVAKT